MKAQKLANMLQQVADEFPDAHAELLHCSCHIELWIEDKNVVDINVDTEEFEYIDRSPKPLAEGETSIPMDGIQEMMRTLLTKDRKKNDGD